MQNTTAALTALVTDLRSACDRLAATVATQPQPEPRAFVVDVPVMFSVPVAVTATDYTDARERALYLWQQAVPADVAETLDLDTSGTQGTWHVAPA